MNAKKHRTGALPKRSPQRGPDGYIIERNGQIRAADAHGGESPPRIGGITEQSDAAKARRNRAIPPRLESFFSQSLSYSLQRGWTMGSSSSTSAKREVGSMK